MKRRAFLKLCLAVPAAAVAIPRRGLRGVPKAFWATADREWTLSEQQWITLGNLQVASPRQTRVLTGISEP